MRCALQSYNDRGNYIACFRYKMLNKHKFLNGVDGEAVEDWGFHKVFRHVSAAEVMEEVPIIEGEAPAVDEEEAGRFKVRCNLMTQLF
uniref:Uncharacterized protein n=1 Tax=Panagrolaimus superbus TaxID=310955 RepID=A0A914YBY8_9BILA